MNEHFELVSKYSPNGDQPKAIEQLVNGLNENKKAQVLLGATGTGKTFTIANVIAKVNRPTLVFEPNKTLAGQLYSEFKEIFPNNRVEYFVSNFDYYQPEAYVPKTDTYIEKSTSINDELDMLRMAAMNSVLDRRDTIIVASVACIYASDNPQVYKDMFFTIRVGETYQRNDLLRKFVNVQYTRNDMEAKRGTFSVKGDVIDVVLGYTDQFLLRIEMFDDEIERICEIDPLTKKVIAAYSLYNVSPATGYARDSGSMATACNNIEAELKERLKYFEDNGLLLEKERLEQRVTFDLESLREFGRCSGIENYSMHIDGRVPGQRPYNLFDYFPEDYLLVIDESHVSLPQIKGMYFGDHNRKQTLVDYGFRLPSALENRPMKFDEFEQMTNQVIYVSATPGDYELDQTHNEIVEQIIRPTGLLDPLVSIHPTMGQIDVILDEIKIRIAKQERVLITTLTVKMAEDLTDYLKSHDIKVKHLHHETKTLERSETIRDLRLGKIDVIVGINLLREGLDIPEVSLVCILDADKEGFLRSERSLIQTIGRAARNAHGEVYLFADTVTKSMKKAMDETNRRRSIQEAYNKEHAIVPKTIHKQVQDAIAGKETQKMAMDYLKKKNKTSKQDKQQLIDKLRKEMKEAARTMDFERAAQLRDMVFELESE